ncbi:MAG: hypothetical protein ACLT49_09565 [Sutterella wadsworthensis]
MSQFIQTFLTGGFMMWPLLAASIVTIAIAVERTVFYRRSASDMQVLQGEFLSAVRAKILMLQPHFAKSRRHRRCSS